MDLLLGIKIFLFSILVALLFWWRYGREHVPDFTGEYYQALPETYSPAELGVLWNMGLVEVKELTATILDLARRKHIRIEKNVQEDFTLVKGENPEDTLLKHEQKLLEFLFNTLDGQRNGRVSLGQLEAWAQKNRWKMYKFWGEWQHTVKYEAKKYRFFDQATQKARLIELILGAIPFGLSSVFFIFHLVVAGISAIISGIILITAGAVMARRSREGNNDFHKWKAFRRYLERFPEVYRYELPSLLTWEQYLAYAVTLGVSSVMVKQLTIIYPGLAEGSYRFAAGWFVFREDAARGDAGSINNMIQAIHQSFHKSIMLATSSNYSGLNQGAG